MKLTQKLLAFLGRVFDKDPQTFLALRISYESGAMTWNVSNAVLTTAPVGGGGQPLTVDLTQFTVFGLVQFIASQRGYSIPYVDGTDLNQLSARVLLDGSGNIAESNGDHIHGYTSPLWAYLEAASLELDRAASAIIEMLKQMSTTTGSDIWLDEWGGVYGIPRLQGESDAAYGQRIIAEVLRARGNNVAIELAIKQFTGQDAKVTDVVEWTTPLPKYNGAITHNSASNYNSTAQPIYGKFDVEYGYDLLTGGDIASFQAIVSGLIDRLRDAGTHLRSVLLKGSALFDTYTTPPTDLAEMPLVVGVPLADTRAAPTEAQTMNVDMADMAETNAIGGAADGTACTFTFLHKYDSSRTHDSNILYRGGWQFTGAPADNEFAGAGAMI